MDESRDSCPLHGGKGKKNWWFTLPGLLCIAVLIAAGLYLIIVHKQHVLGALPLLLVLACPLMHLFMCRGHKHGGDKEQ